MKKIITLGLIGMVVLTTVGCGCSKKEEETKKKTGKVANTAKEVIKDQKVESFKMTNTSLIYDGKQSTLVTEVTNTSDKTEHIKTFNILVKDKDGNEMITLLGYIGEEIPAGETRTITSGTNKDLSKAADIEYSINR